MAIDLRSDTVTLPTPAMRAAMAAAAVGDDVYGEDPTVAELEGFVAAAAGKEAGLLLPSGTMSNLVAMMVLADRRHSEFIVGAAAHVALFEAAGVAQVAHAMPRLVPNGADGALDLAAAAAAVQEADVHCAVTRAVLVENTHCFRGGRVVPPAAMRDLRRLCDAHRLPIHCDGARLWHAAVAQGVPLAAVAAPFDSVSLCLSKALGAPAGSVLVGGRGFIDAARHSRKLLGGGMRQAGVLAAAGLLAARAFERRVAEDHEMAAALADGLAARGLRRFVRPPETNIVLAEVPAGAAPRLAEAAGRRGVRLSYLDGGLLRAVPHIGITAADLEKAAEVTAAAFKEEGLL